MIEGTANENYEATIRLTLRVVAGDDREIETIIDTGYTGYLVLPTMLIDRVGLSWRGRVQGLLADGSLHVFDAYEGTILWNGHDLTVEVDAADTHQPLVGMGLLRGHALSVDVVQNGTVKIEALT